MIFIDANIFMYAAGRKSPQKEPCLRFLDSVISKPRLKSCTNAEVLQEILHRYTLTGERSNGLKIFDLVLSLGLPVLPIRTDDLRAARLLLEEDISISVRDAVHLGVMQSNGISKIASFDKAFKKISWIEVVDLEYK